MKKHSFQAWSKMVFVRGSDKIKYAELIPGLSIQYAIKNNKYPKTIQESVVVMYKVKFKAEKNHDKSDAHKYNKNGDGEQDNLNETSFSQT